MQIHTCNISGRHFLRSFTTPFIQRYVRTQWVPARSALVAVGVSHARALQYAAEKFDWAREAASPKQTHNEDSMFYPNEYEPSPAPHETAAGGTGGTSGAGGVTSERARFCGGERRLATADHTVHAALVTESSGYAAQNSI